MIRPTDGGGGGQTCQKRRRPLALPTRRRTEKRRAATPPLRLAPRPRRAHLIFPAAAAGARGRRGAGTPPGAAPLAAPGPAALPGQRGGGQPLRRPGHVAGSRPAALRVSERVWAGQSRRRRLPPRSHARRGRPALRSLRRRPGPTDGCREMGAPEPAPAAAEFVWMAGTAEIVFPVSTAGSGAVGARTLPACSPRRPGWLSDASVPHPPSHAPRSSCRHRGRSWQQRPRGYAAGSSPDPHRLSLPLFIHHQLEKDDVESTTLCIA